MTCLFALKKAFWFPKLDFLMAIFMLPQHGGNNGCLATHAEKNRAAPETWWPTTGLVLLLRKDDCCCRCLELLWAAPAETGSYIGQIACFQLQGIWSCRPCLGSKHITTNQRSNFSFWQGLTIFNSTIVWIIKLQLSYFGKNLRRFSNLLLQERRKSIEY